MPVITAEWIFGVTIRVPFFVGHSIKSLSLGTFNSKVAKIHTEVDWLMSFFNLVNEIGSS